MWGFFQLSEETLSASPWSVGLQQTPTTMLPTLVCPLILTHKLPVSWPPISSRTLCIPAALPHSGQLPLLAVPACPLQWPVTIHCSTPVMWDFPLCFCDLSETADLQWHADLQFLLFVPHPACRMCAGTAPGDDNFSDKVSELSSQWSVITVKIVKQIQNWFVFHLV